MDRRLGSEESAVWLQHRDKVVRQPERRQPPHQLRRRQHLMGQRMQLRRGERAAHQHAVGRPDLGDAGDMEKLLPGRSFELAPQLIGAPQERHIGRMLPIGQADDARRSMG